MAEIPARFPPPMGRTTRDSDGTIRPVKEPVVVECGQTVRLGGVLVTCIRKVGHKPLFDHSNGYTEWWFDAPEGDTKA